jgi:DNA polymerase-3 subunit gamma/tau
LEGLANKDANYILNAIAELATFAADFVGVLDGLLNIFHQITIAQLTSSEANLLCEDDEQVKKFAARFSADEIQLYYQIGLIGKRDLFLAPTPRSGFEMVMLRMLAFSPQTAGAKLTTAKTSVVAEMRADGNLATVPKTSNTSNNSSNNDILAQLKVTGPTAALLKHCMVAKIGENYVDLLIATAQAPLLNKSARERVGAAFSEFFGKPMRVEITVDSSDIVTPAKEEQQKLNQQQAEAMQTLASDANVQKIVKAFDAKIVDAIINH